MERKEVVRMADRQRGRNERIHGQVYVYGNILKKGQTEESAAEPEKKKKKVSRQTRRNQKRALKLGFGYVSFFGAAAIIALLVCFQYVGMRADMSKQSRKIETLRAEIADLKEANTSEYNHITNSITLESVREQAEALGMVYADPSQVIMYQTPGDRYIKQYESIPGDGILDEEQKTE